MMLTTVNVDFLVSSPAVKPGWYQGRLEGSCRSPINLSFDRVKQQNEINSAMLSLYRYYIYVAKQYVHHHASSQKEIRISVLNASGASF